VRHGLAKLMIVRIPTAINFIEAHMTLPAEASIESATSFELSPNFIRGLEEKVSTGNYGKYLKRVILHKVRGFVNREVTFDFPVTAIVGPNGGGKTTVLGAAALAYKVVPPSRFFAKSGRYDSSMVKWSIEHLVIDKEIDRRLEVRRSVNFPTSKWNRTPFDREVLIFGVNRTVPATERPELRKAQGGSFRATSETVLPPIVVSEAEKILGKSIAGYSELDVTASGRARLYAATDKESGNRYSEFHFGAGEASIIKIVSGIELAADNSLILIEEIENGLHPVATRRLVEYLLKVAKRKSSQVIFTTHSNSALEPLPPKAIWAAFKGEVIQGALNIEALRTITGHIDSKLAIFVEDSYGELMIGTALRYAKADLRAIKVHGMGGHDPAIQMNAHHNGNPTRTFESVAIVDGDQRSRADASKRIYAFPGDDDPEAHVFDSVHGKMDELAARLTVGLNLPVSEQGRVKSVVNERAITNEDRHIIFAQIGEDLDFTSELVVQNAFLAQWAQVYPDEVAELIAPFRELLPFH
jgi:ABC-type multidrug transport system ATPase subunit